MASEVRFEVEAARIDDHFGVVVYIHDGDEVPKDGDEVACYFLVFKGSTDLDPSETAQQFSLCHQEAMDSVALEGVLTEEAFADKLDSSFEIAGQLMIRHGYAAVDVETVDPDMMDALFSEEMEESGSKDPFRLN